LISKTLSDTEISREEILELAYPLEGHPDNLAASLFGGWVISRLSGKRVAAESIQSLVRCKFVVVVPTLRISTAQAREILPESFSLEQVAFNLQRNALMIHAMHKGDTHLIREAVADQLHQPYRARLVPGLASLLERENLPSELDEALYGVAISGSGSTVLGLTGGYEDQVAQWMVESLAKAGTEAVPMVLELDRVGARVVGRTQPSDFKN
jgi:homoserine kinase